MTIAKNPILSGFYPDPSICRVGEDYYLVNSSFVYFPGVPVFHSKDLAHWEQIGNILDREEQFPVDEGEEEISRGIFAPTIRYHEGIFYMVTTNVSHRGNFIVTAEDPRGPWSVPHYLGEEAAGIDPSLFFDDDGKCYYVGTRPNPEGERYYGDNEIWVQELDLEKMELTGKSVGIWNGALKRAVWPEGPHLYKIDGYYYLLHAEGGTGPEHSICVARSRELFAWFEGCPRNPVFTHRNLGKEYPVTYAGHADLVDDPQGNWYAVMLATRKCLGHGSMGRETFLAKVTWEDGWPVFNPGIGRLEERVELPTQEWHPDREVSGMDEFHFRGKRLDDRLIGIKTREDGRYSLTERMGFLRLYSHDTAISSPGAPSYLGVRQKGYCFEASCALEFIPAGKGERAGMVLFQNHANHLRIEVMKGTSGRLLRVTAHCMGKDVIISETEIARHGLAEICLCARNQKADIFLIQGDERKEAAHKVSLLPYTTEKAGGFVGCTLGMYVYSPDTKCFADFAWFRVNSAGED